MVTKSWTPISGNSTGDILKSGFSYTGASDNNPDISRNTGTGAESRAYLNFQTGIDPIPLRAIVEKVEFLLRIDEDTSSISTAPTSWKWTFYAGKDVVQDAITTNESSIWASVDWKDCGDEIFAATPVDTDFDLGQVGIDNFNRTGDTDINVRDTSVWGIFGAVFNIVIYGVSGGRSSQLKVTYRIGLIKNCKIYDAKLYCVSGAK